MITSHRGCAKRSTRRESCAIGVATANDSDGYQPAGEEIDPAILAEVKEDCAAMLEALEELPPRHAKFLKARYLEGQEYEEIAAAEGIPVSAVRSVVSRALANARGLVSA